MKCTVCDRPALHLGDLILAKCWAHSDDTERQAVFGKLAEAQDGRELPAVALPEFEFSLQAYRNLLFSLGSLSGAQFKDALLSNVTFHGTDLSGVDFRGAHLDNVTFFGVDGPRLDFSRARLTGCKFAKGERHGCLLQQANFSNAILLKVDFEVDTCLEESTFSAASLTKVSFMQCVASNANLQNLRCEDVHFTRGDFDRVFFSDSVFLCRKGSIFERVNLEGSDFRRISIDDGQGPGEDTSAPQIGAFLGCELPNCDFGSAQLDRCLFQRGDATSSNFENAGLTKSQFRGIKLTSAVFAGAYLKGTQFMSVEGEGQLLLDAARFENAILAGVKLLNVRAAAAVFTAARLEERCTFRDCDFLSASFSQAVFKNAELLGKTNFGDASLVGVSFEDCRIESAIFRDADLKGSTFKSIERPDVKQALDFSGSDLSDSLLEADLRWCCFLGATLHNTSLAKSKLSYTHFDEARLSLCDLRGLRDLRDVMGASFRGARILDCFLDHSVFRGCWFTGATLAGCSTVRPSLTISEALSGGVVEETEGVYQWLVNTSFLGCDFSSADLSNCILAGADFAESILVRASFRGSDLRDTKLLARDARLADFEGAIFGLKPAEGATENGPLLNSLIRPATLTGLKAESASFTDADLYGCDLTGATLDRARLDNANVEGAVVQDCTFEGANLVGVVGFHKLARIDSLRKSTRAPNFSYAYIQATQAFSYSSAEWEEFRKWINLNREATPERKRLSWVAWKNNFESLGLYAEQSECFQEEQIARGWEPVHRLPWRAFGRHSRTVTSFLQVLLLALLSSLALMVLGWAYHHLVVVEELGDESAFRIGFGGAVILVFLGCVLWWSERDFIRRIGLALIDTLYGFGEQPAKILLNAVFAVLIFSAMHCVAVESGWGGFDRPPKSSGEYVYFSVVTFTTLGYGDIQPLRFCRFLAGCESLLGLVMAALFIHALARRTAGR